MRKSTLWRHPVGAGHEWGELVKARQSHQQQEANNPQGTRLNAMTNKQVESSAKRKPPAAGKGRPKGSLNKTTALLKDAILKAAENAGNKVGSDGLVSYLEKQAEENPGPFMSLLGKVLPMQIEGGDNPIKTVTTINLVAVKPE
ncbi:hypothetical protein [Celeribacter sp. SCSIO 80788]|uniref:hypothetical protein n=1 Tax=Celeribacter sp. SCSIO 80788 TaxID=3117013 RepID=UPI003DA55357